MIQELFGGSAASPLLNRDSNNISISSSNSNASFEPSSPSPSSSSAAATAAAAASETQKLRCPRCDSSNTKFCYYNNYNLTQPRHFCKTCRRYWTKGGALRNVPIGGGCRKNKPTTIATSTGKLKAVVSSDLGKSAFINDHFPSNPILWAGPSHTSHLLSLLRPAQSPNPNPNPNFASNSVSNESGSFMIGSNMSNLGFDQVGRGSSLGLCTSLWRNGHDQQQNGGIMSGHEVQNTGNSLNQRLRSSPGSYYHQDQTTPVILGGNVGITSSSSTILEPAAAVVGGGEMGFWNPALPWSDLPAANGAFP